MLKPLVVIIQDFPLFATWYFTMKAFAIKCYSKSKQKINFHKQTIKLFAIRQKILDGMAYIKNIAKPKKIILFAIKNKISSLIKIIAKSSNKIAIKVNANLLAKIKQKVTGKIETGKFKAYLKKDGYMIGIPATLGHWDDYGNRTLGDMDNLTMSDLAILKVDA